MGIIDRISSGLSGSSPMLGIVAGLFNQHGGVGGIIQLFQNKGLGHVAQSWLGGSSRVIPIEPEQVGDVFGKDSLDAMASKANLPTSIFTQQLAHVLPVVVGKLTPNGKVPSGNVSVEQLGSVGIGELLGNFRSKKSA